MDGLFAVYCNFLRENNITEQIKMKRTYQKPETVLHEAVGSLLLEQLPVSGTGVDHGEVREREELEEEEAFLEALAAEEQTSLW